MNKSTLKINGEIDDIVQVASPFTHDAPTGFFDGLGDYKMIGTEISESLQSGFFVATITFESEIEPTVDNVQTLINEFDDVKSIFMLETVSGLLISSSDGNVAV